MGLLDAHGGKEVHAVLREIVNGIRRLALVNILSGITLIVSDGANTVTEQRPKKVELMPIGLAAVNKDQRVSISAFLIANASRSEEHTSELQSLMRISYAVFCLKKKKNKKNNVKRHQLIPILRTINNKQEH